MRVNFKLQQSVELEGEAQEEQLADARQPKPSKGTIAQATETAAGDKPSPKNSQNKKVEREQARTERRADNKVENRRIVEQEKQDRQEAKKLEALNIKLLRKKVGIILEPTAVSEWSSKRAKQEERRKSDPAKQKRRGGRAEVARATQPDRRDEGRWTEET